jgi:hypothetical protein
VIVERPAISRKELERRTGWEVRPEGACKGNRCIPLPESEGPELELEVLSERLGMALVQDPEHGLWALGPEAGRRALLSAELPEVALPDRHGRRFSLDSLRGTKVLLLAWASW